MLRSSRWSESNLSEQSPGVRLKVLGCGRIGPQSFPASTHALTHGGDQWAGEQALSAKKAALAADFMVHRQGLEPRTR